jgi:hypothetical protein
VLRTLDKELVQHFQIPLFSFPAAFSRPFPSLDIQILPNHILDLRSGATPLLALEFFA